MSIVTYHKPAPSITLPDWHCSIWSLRKHAADKNDNSFKLRHEGTQLRNEGNIKTKWDTYLTNGRIEDRLSEQRRWKDVLELSLRQVEGLLSTLGEEKANVERELERIGQDLSVLAQCMALRETRKWPDYVFDGAYCEFENEKTMLDMLKKTITDRAYSAWRLFSGLKEMQLKLKIDICNKEEAIAMDVENLQMDKDSDKISFKIDATRKPSEMLSNEAWAEHVRKEKDETDKLVLSADKMREMLQATLVKAENDLAAQHEATDYALRNTIYQVQRAKNELEWQKTKAIRNMELLMKEVCELEEALRVKTASQQLAETRLEKRLYRSGSELACDDAHEALIDEAITLRTTIVELKGHINHIKGTYNEMEKLVTDLDEELESKNYSIFVDMRCLDLRKCMYKGDRAPFPTPTDRNINLVRMEEELPPE